MKTWIQEAEDRKIKWWRWKELGEQEWTIQIWAILIIHVDRP